MPLFLLIIGLAVLWIGVRGQAGAAMVLLASEFTGPNSFVQWFLAIMILGLLGYIRPIRPVADAMLGLVLLGIFLAKGGQNGGGFFANLESAFQHTTAAPAKPLVQGASSASSTIAGANLFGVPALTSLPTNQQAGQVLTPAITALPGATLTGPSLGSILSSVPMSY